MGLLNTILNEGCYCPTVDNNFFNDELNRISNTVEENLSKLDKEKENGIVKIKIKSPNLNLDKEFKLNAKESFEDVEKEFRNIFGEELKNKGMKDIIEKVDKKNKLNEKNIVEDSFNSDFVSPVSRSYSALIDIRLDISTIQYTVPSSRSFLSIDLRYLSKYARLLSSV